MPRPRRSGLSLLEVLLSVAILLMALAMISPLVDFGSGRGEAAVMKRIALRLAQSKLSEAEAGLVSVSTSSSGVYETEADWSWTLTSNSTDIPNVYDLEVTAWRVIGGRRQECTLRRRMFDPSQRGGPKALSRPTTGDTP